MDNVFDLPKKRVSKIKNQTMLRSNRIIYYNFSKYFRPLLRLEKAADVLQTTDNRQNSKIIDRQIFLIFT